MSNFLSEKAILEMESMFGKEYADKIRKSQQPQIVDRTDLEKMATCPQQYQLCKEQKIDVDSELAQIGTEIHRLAEEAFKAGYETRANPEDVADYIVNELPKARPDIQPQVLRMGKWLADKAANIPIHRLLADQKGVPFIEYQIDYLFDSIKNKDGQPYKITTCIDLAFSGNNSIHVIDWKTGFKKRSNQEAFDSIQAEFITLILWKMFPQINIIHFWFYETRWGTSAYACFDRESEEPRLPHLTQEMAFQQRIISTLQLFRYDCRDAWPEPKKCSQCDLIKFCEYANKRAFDLAKDPKAFIDQIVVLDELLTKQKKTASDYVKAHGAIQGTKVKFDWIPSKPKFIPKIYDIDENTESED